MRLDPTLPRVRAAISDLLNVIDDAKRGADLTERGVEWLDTLEARVEELAREMDRNEEADRRAWEER